MGSPFDDIIKHMTEIRKQKDHVGGREEAKEESKEGHMASTANYSRSNPSRCQTFRTEDSSRTLTRATITTR